MTRPTPSTPPDRTVSQKSTLHCPVCGHESPADGDWQVARDENAETIEAGRERVTYTCPECETVLTTRSRRRAVVA